MVAPRGVLSTCVRCTCPSEEPFVSLLSIRSAMSGLLVAVFLLCPGSGHSQLLPKSVNIRGFGSIVLDLTSRDSIRAFIRDSVACGPIRLRIAGSVKTPRPFYLHGWEFAATVSVFITNGGEPVQIG